MIKKILIVVLVILVLAAGGAYYCYNNINNNLIRSGVQIKEQWMNIEKEYQNFTNLVPDLSQAIVDYVKNDQLLFDKVAETKKTVDKMAINTDKLDKQEMKQYVQSQDEYVLLVNQLLFIAKAYPDLNSESRFKEIRTQLKEVEKNIVSEKIKYNEIVLEYNTGITQYPNRIVADMKKLRGKPFFQIINN